MNAQLLGMKRPYDKVETIICIDLEEGEVSPSDEILTINNEKSNVCSSCEILAIVVTSGLQILNDSSCNERYLVMNINDIASLASVSHEKIMKSIACKRAGQISNLPVAVIKNANSLGVPMTLMMRLKRLLELKDYKKWNEADSRLSTVHGDARDLLDFLGSSVIMEALFQITCNLEGLMARISQPKELFKCTSLALEIVSACPAREHAPSVTLSCCIPQIRALIEAFKEALEIEKFAIEWDSLSVETSLSHLEKILRIMYEWTSANASVLEDAIKIRANASCIDELGVLLSNIASSWKTRRTEHIVAEARRAAFSIATQPTLNVFSREFPSDQPRAHQPGLDITTFSASLNFAKETKDSQRKLNDSDSEIEMTQKEHVGIRNGVDVIDEAEIIHIKMMVRKPRFVAHTTVTAYENGTSPSFIRSSERKKTALRLVKEEGKHLFRYRNIMSSGCIFCKLVHIPICSECSQCIRCFREKKFGETCNGNVPDECSRWSPTRDESKLESIIAPVNKLTVSKARVDPRKKRMKGLEPAEVTQDKKVERNSKESLNALNPKSSSFIEKKEKKANSEAPPLQARVDRAIYAAFISSGSTSDFAPLLALLRNSSLYKYRRITGETALHAAAFHGNICVAREILRGGADPEVSDSHGLSPLQLARQRKHYEMVELLERWLNRLHPANNVDVSVSLPLLQNMAPNNLPFPPIDFSCIPPPNPTLPPPPNFQSGVLHYTPVSAPPFSFRGTNLSTAAALPMCSSSDNSFSAGNKGVFNKHENSTPRKYSFMKSDQLSSMSSGMHIMNTLPLPPPTPFVAPENLSYRQNTKSIVALQPPLVRKHSVGAKQRSRKKYHSPLQSKHWNDRRSNNYTSPPRTSYLQTPYSCPVNGGPSPQQSLNTSPNTPFLPSPPVKPQANMKRDKRHRTRVHRS